MAFENFVLHSSKLSTANVAEGKSLHSFIEILLSEGFIAFCLESVSHNSITVLGRRGFYMSLYRNMD